MKTSHTHQPAKKTKTSSESKVLTLGTSTDAISSLTNKKGVIPLGSSGTNISGTNYTSQKDNRSWDPSNQKYTLSQPSPLNQRKGKSPTTQPKQKMPTINSIPGPSRSASNQTPLEAPTGIARVGPPSPDRHHRSILTHNQLALKLLLKHNKVIEWPAEAKPKQELPLLPLEAGDLQPQPEEQEEQPPEVRDLPYQWRKQISRTSFKPSPGNSTSTSEEEEDQEDPEDLEDPEEEAHQDRNQYHQPSLFRWPRHKTYDTSETHQPTSTETNKECDSSSENWETISAPIEESQDSSLPSNASLSPSPS